MRVCVCARMCVGKVNFQEDTTDDSAGVSEEVPKWVPYITAAGVVAIAVLVLLILLHLKRTRGEMIRYCSDFPRACSNLCPIRYLGVSPGELPREKISLGWLKSQFFKDWHQNCTRKIVQSVQLAFKSTNLRPLTQKNLR